MSIASLKIRYNQVHGYYIEITNYLNWLFNNDDPRGEFMVDIALHNLSSSNLKIKGTALQQLPQLYHHDKTYFGVIDYIHKDE